ncbi:transcription initiation factor TFIID subunit 13 [Favolaschia claudopus]|uniref:Transcription initiation factor TFIID subunit 13 n=1 Tax=Favolaschia claudopus TaxID=2862362 RepID=A0AAW0B190_9AGAR
MSQQPYGQYTPSGTQTPPATPTTYPYGAYTAAAYPPHTPYAQTPGAYPYQNPGAFQYATAWKYAYPYGQQLPAGQARPAPATPPAATARTSTPNPPQRSNTFSSYTPSQLRGKLKNLMYGFGDDRNPATDTVNVMEEILIEYITDVCQTAGAQTKRARLTIEDLRRTLNARAAQFSEDVPNAKDFEH